MRQRISLLAACGLVAVGLTTPTAMAAESADPVFRLDGQSALALRPYPATGSPQPVAVSFHLEDTGSFGGEFTFTVDRAPVAGIASVKESSAAPQKCVESGTKLICKDKGPRPGVDLVATAEKEAKEGASGTVEVTGTAAGATVTPARTTLQIGGPDLLMKDLGLKKDPKPGESQALPLAFRNESTQSAKGVVLELEATRGLELPERYDNCTYRTTGTATKVVCTVEGEFEGKATYELAGDSPLHLKAGANALNERFGYGIYPLGAPQKAADAKRPDAAGAATAAGRKLTARKKAEAAPAPLRAPDLNPVDNKRVADLTVPNTADFAAEPLTVKGAAGTTVKAVVAARNNGPAWVAGTGPAAVVDVVLPQGVKVVTAPAACRAVQPALYRCATGPVVLENEKLAFPFELKIEKAVKDAKGAITVGGLDAKGEPKRHDFDKVLTNNQAAFTANPTATPTKSPSPSASGSASPSASKSASPSAGSSTGSTTGNNASAAAGGRSAGPLASTGSTAGLVGLAGAGLFAVGAALYLSFRRRGNGGAHA
ncbi:hypothetical protein [Streptomyces lavendulae]|uniref:hypothetical protein n=1 Tax=Streptomyces lavendulae TaxID=1914 RepID=UPI002556CC52|nr:hypothetical protein [Streptomyces lavendulae]